MKSRMLYDAIDKSNGFYVNRTDKKFRSRMNVNFRIECNRGLEEALMREAAKKKLINIKGHPANPGIRVSMYNAMPVQGVVELCQFLDEFRQTHDIAQKAG